MGLNSGFRSKAAASGGARPGDVGDPAEILPEIWKFGNLEIWAAPFAGLKLICVRLSCSSVLVLRATSRRIRWWPGSAHRPGYHFSGRLIANVGIFGAHSRPWSMGWRPFYLDNFFWYGLALRFLRFWLTLNFSWYGRAQFIRYGRCLCVPGPLCLCINCHVSCVRWLRALAHTLDPASAPIG